MKKNYLYIGHAVIIILLATVMFFTGSWYGSQKNKNLAGGNNMRGAQFGTKGAGGQGGNRMGANRAGGINRGEIVSKDANTITLKLFDGGSKVLLYSPTTVVNKTIAGSLDDVKVGGSIMVTGDANPDGSITAKSLQLVSSSTARF
ncbi:MAG: hypothetical protein WCT11_02890 [Candidatus Magasanikbacteria bacterium]